MGSRRAAQVALTEEFELGIFDRPSRQTVGRDWEVAGYPDEFIPSPMSPEMAHELLCVFDGEQVSAPLEAWLRDVRGSADDCLAQTSLLGDVK